MFLSMMSRRTPTVQWNIVDAVSRSQSEGQRVKMSKSRERVQDLVPYKDVKSYVCSALERLTGY
jgi:hypothetical protein